VSAGVNSLTISIINQLGTSSALELVGIVTLLILLAQKFLAAAAEDRLARALNLALDAPLVAFLLAFILIVVMRIIELLNA